MLRTFLRLRPYFYGTFLAVILTVNWSNEWNVEVRRLPAEIYERWIVRVNPKASPAELLKLAEGGNSMAQYVYALRHTPYAPVDLQINEDKVNAFKWTLKAAEGGHSRAMAVASLYYFRGDGTSKDVAKARDWAEKSVKKGQSMGYRMLGDLAKKAAEDQKPAPEDARYKHKLVEYEKAMKEAYAHYEDGSARGDRVALRMMSEGHEKGVPGMPRNYRLAQEYLIRAAMLRDNISIRRLADRYETGERLDVDLTQAYVWRLVLVELERKPKDDEALTGLEKKMKPSEIRTAQAEAKKIYDKLPTEAADALTMLRASR
jgi:TPR repeat protein